MFATTDASSAAVAKRDEPLVTIGIPAYNRPETLSRAIRSALAQSQVRIEVLVSDDHSPDPEVAEVARDLAASDPRVRVVRQDRNLGHAANYQWVLAAAQGEYFMWLADDDWLDPGYVGRCLNTLRDDGSTVLVCGTARYYCDGTPIGDERAIDLLSARPGVRVLRYFTRVTMNGPLFSVGRRAELLATGFPQALGGDWLLVGSLAGRGRIRCLEDVHIHRSATGLGSDGVGLARGFGLRGVRARHHHLFLAAQIWREIITGARSFPDLNPVGRVVVASGAALSIVVRFTIVGVVRDGLGAQRVIRVERALSRALRRVDAIASAWRGSS